MSTLIRKRWIGQPPRWPFGLNTSSPQACGLILFCPPIPDPAVCRDLSPSQQHGSIGTNITLVGAPQGSVAFLQDGTQLTTANIDWTWSTLVNLPDVSNGPNFSISTWAYKPVSESDKPIWSWDGSDDLLLYPNDPALGGGARMFWRDAGGSFIIDTPNLGGTPHVLTFTVSSAPRRALFLNGKLIASNTDSLAGVGPFSSFSWLGWNGSGAQQLNGAAWWLRVWNRTLSDAEVAAYDGDPSQWWDLATPRRTFVVVPAAGGPSIASIDGDDIVYGGQQAALVAGSGFGATQ